MSPSILRRLVLLAPALATSALPGAGGAQGPAPDRPALIVFITVDQLRADYIDRFGARLTGGLARMARGGALYTNAFQDHAVTETAPGHSVVLSGRFPRSTGIVSNAAGVLDPQSPLLTSRDAPASPFRFRGSVLMDWLRAHDQRSRGLSISRKDRGAIFPMGRAKQSVFWYATTNGEFTTSRYYADTLPTWVRALNARRSAQQLAGRAWTLSRPASEYPEPDSVAIENEGVRVTFPHVLPTDTARLFSEIVYTPFIDELTAAAALEGVQALQLGRGPQTDLLAVSLSGSDYVGHRYGPDSREVHDHMLRLDRTLGTFIDSLYALRDSSTIVIALSADHGVTAFPEITAARTGGAPARYDLAPAVRAMRANLRAAGVDTTAVSLDGGMVFVHRERFRHAGVDPDPILSRFAAEVRRIPHIARVDRVRDLAARDTTRDQVARRWARMIPDDSPVEWLITPRAGAYPRAYTSAMHGEPYDDDARVPVIFYGPWFTPARHRQRVLVADIAPTLARVAGVRPTERLDGRVRTEALSSRVPR